MQRCSLKTTTSLLILTSLGLLTIHYQMEFLGLRNQPLKMISEISLRNALLQRKVPSAEFRNYSYIHSAFRVSDNVIRVTFIRQHKKHEPVFYKYGKKQGTVAFYCALPSCLDLFSKPCSLIGQIGVIQEPFTEGLTFIEFTANKNPGDHYEVKIQIKDARIKSNHIYPHQLGVCVQPIYLHADYVLFVQFFEFWLSQGATKFYIYRESYTQEVQEILKLYNMTSEADIEFVDWSLLPAFPGVDTKFNPNAYIYRLEMMLSIFDCLHRARGNVKFIAQTDLDELIYIKSGETVLSFMESFSEEKPFFSSVSFQSQRISFDEHALESIESPLDINFTNFEEVQLENFTFARPYYSKIIYRPERVFRVHPHQQFPPEKVPNSNRRFENKVIDPNEGVVLHMRRSADSFKWKQTTKSDILKPLATQWTENYQSRIFGLSKDSFEETPWLNIGVQVVREVDACRKKVYKKKDKECHNVFVCEESLSEKYAKSFIHSNNSWVFV